MSKYVAVIAALAALSCMTVAAAHGGTGHSSGSYSSGRHTSGSRATAGSHSIRAYTKRDGTHVGPSHATNPNRTKRDNYSSRGNVNPYTGKPGHKDPDAPGK